MYALLLLMDFFQYFVVSTESYTVLERSSRVAASKYIFNPSLKSEVWGIDLYGNRGLCHRERERFVPDRSANASKKVTIQRGEGATTSFQYGTQPAAQQFVISR